MPQSIRFRTIIAASILFCGLGAVVAQSQTTAKATTRFSAAHLKRLGELVAEHGRDARLSPGITTALGLTAGSSETLNLRQLGTMDRLCNHVFHVLPKNGGYLLSCINDDSASSYALNARQELGRAVVSRTRGGSPARIPVRDAQKQIDGEIAFWISVVDRSNRPAR